MHRRKWLTALVVLIGVTAGGFVMVGSAGAASSGADFRADTFRLVNIATDQCADLSTKSTTGREVVQEPCRGMPTQVWRAERVSEATFDIQLVNQATGLCMDLLAGGESGDGTPVVQAHCSFKLVSQQWQFEFAGVLGLFRVVNLALGQCLEVKDGSLAQGAPIQVSTCLESADHQVWNKIDVIGSSSG